MKIIKESFGKLGDGREADLYTLSNNGKLEIKITNYGGIVTSVLMPDKKGNRDEINLGFDNLKTYLGGHPYFGALIGRYANRIGKSVFTLDGVSYKITPNEGQNHLHGGLKGFDKVLWQAATRSSDKEVSLVLKYTCRDGEEGYPGNADVTAAYTLTDQDELRMEYEGVADKASPFNVTNHCYFNLAGAGSGPVYDHIMQLNCPYYLPIDPESIPTGKIAKVSGTPFDFLKGRPIGEDINNVPGGYDHCWVLESGGQGLKLAARVTEPGSGRVLEVLTTKPGIQFYSGNYLNGIKGPDGKVFEKHGAFCLESEYYPDSPNRPAFPDSILRPGEVYRHTTVYKFSLA